MKNTLRHRGYFGSIEFSEEDMVFHGKVIGIRSTLSYEGDSAQALVEDFRSAVDEYLEECDTKAIEPERPFKGSFNVRINPELHQLAALIASQKGESLNAFVEEAIAYETSRCETTKHAFA